MNILDILFPKSCAGCGKWGSYLCASCFTRISFSVSHICVQCNEASIDGRVHPRCLTSHSLKGVLCATTYDSMMKKLLHLYKYPPYVKDLETILVDLFYESLIQKELFYKIQNPVFVPIPLYPQKYRERGYNQAEELAKLLGNRLQVPVLNVLQRVKKTKTQVNLKKEEREENIKGAFARNEKIQVKERTIILVDDVLTTGATLSEAAKVLYKSGAKEVWGITLAHGY